MINIRKMELSDIGFGLQLCRLSKWNQLEADWIHLFDVSPEGMFIAEYEGQKCATASAVNYGTKLGWIGMILVHPDFRRKGIASALMNKCIEHLQALKVESIKLDATDQGRPVYAKLGFIDEQIICRYVVEKPAGGNLKIQITPDWSQIKMTDVNVFGDDRMALLKTLNNDGFASQVFSRPGNVFGYGFARCGFDASFIGPLVASSKETAKKVFEDLFRQLPAGHIYMDILPQNGQAKELADSIGFKMTRELMRMYLGSPGNSGKTEMIYSATGFELG
jgi:GNAT superfamily N-acetyltransferase